MHYYTKKLMLQTSESRVQVVLPDKLPLPSLVTDVETMKAASQSDNISHGKDANAAHVHPSQRPLSDVHFLHAIDTLVLSKEERRVGGEWTSEVASAAAGVVAEEGAAAAEEDPPTPAGEEGAETVEPPMPPADGAADGAGIAAGAAAARVVPSSPAAADEARTVDDHTAELVSALPGWGHEVKLRVIYTLLRRHGRREGGTRAVLDAVSTLDGRANAHVTLNYFWMQMMTYSIAVVDAEVAKEGGGGGGGGRGGGSGGGVGKGLMESKAKELALTLSMAGPGDQAEVSGGPAKSYIIL